jgi:hypothetical protein
MSKSKLIVSLFLAFLPVFRPPAAAAQTSTGRLHLTTSPLPINLKAKPGETIQTELRVRNSGTATEKLKVGLMKFSAYGEEGKPRLEERAAGDDYFDWVKFSKTELEAPPNEWQSITMTITLPKTAAFGYYYAVTFARSNTKNAEADLETAVRGGSATLVLLEADVPGAKRELAIQEFKVGRRTYEFLPARFSVKLRNKGNIHTAPTGTIFISRGKKEVATVNVNHTRGNILPTSSRIFEAEWGDGFPHYEAKQENGKIVLKDGAPVYELKWDTSDLKKLRFGKYTATVVMVYDDGKRDVPLEASVEFWVVPWRILIGGLIVVVFVGIGVWSTGRKIIGKLRKKKA